jgi:2-iminobutanoate/2-iminopropanoate deaminase
MVTGCRRSDVETGRTHAMCATVVRPPFAMSRQTLRGSGMAITLRSTLDEEQTMTSRVQTFTPPNTPTPIGPYNHVATYDKQIWIGGTAGVDPATGQLANPTVTDQTRQILKSFGVMLEAAGSDLNHVLHVNIFLADMADFEEMNASYVEGMGSHRPARTVVAVKELPKPGVLLTMNLTAVSST